MNHWGHELNRTESNAKNRPDKKPESIRYHKENLQLMTTFQLGEICRSEKLIEGIINPLDKEELIKVIMRYRGADERHLIRTEERRGWADVAKALKTVKLSERKDIRITCQSKITVYEKLAIGFYDGLMLPYDQQLAGTNALVVSGDGKLCAILNIEAKGEDRSCLYLTKAAELSAEESEVKNYSLYCMSRHSSELIYQIYMVENTKLPEHLDVCRVPLLDFEVRKPIELSLPLAMDFGTSNTTAGIYLDSRYFEMAERAARPGLKENDVNYVTFCDILNNWQDTNLIPTVVTVLAVGGGRTKLLFGYEAERLAGSSYVDEGFCVFYDLKRWIGDYEKVEEIYDREGRRGFLKRKEILKEYVSHIIKEAENQFKCRINAVHISCPVKQKAQFIRLFKEILPKYQITENDMIDEGVSVLYNTISTMIQGGRIRYGEEYKALVIDCGGGTTDLCSCSFRIWDKRIAYQIEINTAYENGNTDFGGNNLTYRIMQALKLAVVGQLGGYDGSSVRDILAGFDMDVYRYVDEYGAEKLYQDLDEAYAAAERFLPTKFRDYEQQSRTDYYMVKNNFYFLFHLAETVKKEFYGAAGTLRVALASTPTGDGIDVWIPADKWKLSIYRGERLETVKEFPLMYFQYYEIELLLKGDIYNIIRRFMEDMYEEGKVEDYSIIKLTGQSCKIDIFRDALKEFVPGRAIQYRQRSGGRVNSSELKMTCVDGALRYLRDKRYGFADVTIDTQEPALPYRIIAYTHSGEEVTLIHCLKRGGESGMISRNMENLTLKLYLKDAEGSERYQYTCFSSLSDFREVRYEQIQEKYGQHIRQADTDDIINREVRFFVWSRPAEWTFTVVPVCRKEEGLYLGQEEEYCFENDNWVQNFYDGTK